MYFLPIRSEFSLAIKQTGKTKKSAQIELPFLPYCTNHIASMLVSTRAYFPFRLTAE
jgi:hypothetical protein